MYQNILFVEIDKLFETDVFECNVYNYWTKVFVGVFHLFKILIAVLYCLKGRGLNL